MKTLNFLLCFCALMLMKFNASTADEYEYEEEVESSVVGDIKPSAVGNIPAPLKSPKDEYEYEYEYEEEEEAKRPFNRENPIALGNVKAPVESIPPLTNANAGTFGFIRYEGSGLMRISRPLVDELYLNETSDAYDCLKMVDASTMMYEVVESAEEDSQFNVTKQIGDLRRKMNQVLESATMATGGKGAGNDKDTSTERVPKENYTIAETSNSTSSGNTTFPSGGGKRISFREKQAMRLAMRKEREAKRELMRPKFRLGADCETLICGACKAIVEEFGAAVKEGARNPKIRYIDQVMEGFCQSKNIGLKYIDMVGDICINFEKETLGYKEALIKAFEDDEDWENVAKIARLKGKKKHICMSIGACEEEQFEFQNEPQLKLQENWDDKCFTCQAFAKDLEERVHLSRHVTETNIVGVVRETCDRIDVPQHYRDICQPLVQGKLLDDISWLTKVHSESIVKKAKGEQRFGDKLCEEIDWCQPWVDPEVLKEKEARQSMEAVFF